MTLFKSTVMVLSMGALVSACSDGNAEASAPPVPQAVAPELTQPQVLEQLYAVLRERVREDRVLTRPRLAQNPALRYDRDRDFGHMWKDADRDCLDLRQEILLRDAALPPEAQQNLSRYVSMGRYGKRCIVRGVYDVQHGWHDPYTDRRYSDARLLQIDHTVALSNAYRHGGYEWPQDVREVYANYTGDKHHLLTVDGPENERKLDFGPDRYLPPNVAYQCQFVSDWTRIKFDWNLAMLPRELSAVMDVLKREDCAPQARQLLDYVRANPEGATLHKVAGFLRDAPRKVLKIITLPAS